MAVNVKLGVDLGSFNSNINQAKEQIKSFDAALKYAESSFKATGDAEAAMTTKTQALNGKLQTQKSMVQQYSTALQQMANAGIDPMSTSYQKLQTQMLNAQAAMMDTQAELNELDGSQKKAADSADDLTKSVNSIGKKISLDQVIGGINRITDGLENAGRKAVQLGEQIFSSVMDKARWADDTQTMALMYGIDLDTFMRMQKLVTNGLDTSVDAILTAQTKLKKGIGSESKAVMEVLGELGLSTRGWKKTDFGSYFTVSTLKDSTELFWEAGRALMALGNEYDKEAAAQTLFGRSWKELIPLFKEYKSLEEYNAALDGVTVSSEEDVSALAELNDKIGELKGNLDTLSTDLLATLAPALNEGAEALNGVLSTILEYLETPQGKEALQQLGDSISGLFGDLSKIDPEQVVSGFVEVFEKVTGGIQWLVDNQETAKGILAAILGVWAVAEVSGAALTVVKMIEGIQGLSGAGAATAGAAAGNGWGAAFAAAVLKAAPWLAGAIALLNPAEGGNDSPFDNRTGMLTNEGWSFFDDYAAGRIKSAEWDEIINLVGERYGGLSDILANPAAINAMARALYGDHSFAGINPMAQPEAFRQRINNELFETLESMGYEPKIEITPSEEVEEILQEGAIELTVAGDATGRVYGPGGKLIEPKVEVEPVLPDDAAASISRGIGVVPVRISPVLAITSGVGGMVGGLEAAYRQSVYDSLIQRRANGIPWVDQDRTLTLLDRGERVLTASENRQYTFNNNTYFGNVNLNNGTQVEQLAEAISRNNRRQSRGYGS